MKKHGRRLITLLMHSGVCAATVFGALQVQAATLGHSRVTSAPDQPLRIVVQVKDLNPIDLKSISAQIAPVAAWQEAGLKPPVALDSLSTHLLPGLQDNVMQLVLQSRLVPTDKVLDVLVDLSTDASTQRHQVSVLQTQRPASVQLAVTPKAVAVAPSTGAPSTRASKAPTHTVKQGQNLYGIARAWRDERYNDQQLMAALVEANPQAFINGNMNLLRAGARLVIPDVETVVAISPQQARQLYQTQLEQFDEYRQRIAKGEPPVTVLSPTKEKVVSPTPDLETSTDRLQLSAQSDEDAQKDQQTATAQELAHTAQRLTQLEAAGAKDIQPSSPEEQTQRILDKSPSTLTETQNNSEDQDNSEMQNNSEAEVQTLSTTPVAAVSDLEAVTSSSNTAEASSSWLRSNVLALSLGLFVLLVLFVAWFLRRAHFARMEYAEIVPADSVRPREKSDTAEVEFREIN